MLTDIIKKNKEKPSKKAREKYQNLSEQEKGKQRQYAHEQYRNLTEEEKEKCQYGQKFIENEKQRLVEYISNYSIM